MRKMTRLFILILFIISTQLFFVNNHASACTPAPGKWPPELAVQVAEADYVVVGKLVGPLTNDGDISASTYLMAPYGVMYALEVETYLKGEGTEIIVITGFGFGGGDCLNEPSYERAVFFLKENTGESGDNPSSSSTSFGGGNSEDYMTLEDMSDEDEFFVLSYSYVYSAVIDADSQTIEQVTDLVGDDPYKPVSGSRPNYVEPEPYAQMLMIAGLAVSLLVLMAIIVGVNKRKTETSETTQ